MKTTKKIISLVLIGVCALVPLCSCGSSKDKDETIKIGCLTSAQPIVEIMQQGLEADGYKVEIVIYDDNNMPCTALKDGDINGVITNHKPWMETFNKENGCELMMAEPYIYYSPMRLYSAKYDKVEDIPNGAKIAVPSDPSNLDRSLRMLDAVGLIKLGEKSGDFYTKTEIEKNPKNITLIEAEITTAANSIHDADAVISPATFIALEGSVDVNKYLYDDPESKEKYPLGLIIDSADKDADWVKAAVDYMQTDEAAKAFNDKFNGSYVLYSEDK